MSKNICAPHKYDSENKTCFSAKQLVEMAQAYNRYITKNKLNPKNIQNLENNLVNVDLIKIIENKKYLLSEFKKRFDQVCGGDQICLTQQSFMNDIVKEMRDDIQNNTFRSKGPEDPKEWLSTNDINNIMSQYEKIYTNFKFFGAVPLNCNDLSFCSLYKLNFDEYANKNIDLIGIVFNLDRHGQPGSHWVALFMDLAKGEVYFCDSNGRPPIDNIENIINEFMEYYKKKTGKNAIYKYNSKAYQKDGSECGVYSCNFIIRKLSGESFEQITKNALSFQDINSCRNTYFRNAPSKFKPHPKCDPN